VSMFCINCGTQLPDNAKFCYKCGAAQAVNAGQSTQTQAVGASERKVIADASVIELKCPGCGAPIKPQFGEMVITCEYCGSSITLAQSGWSEIQKHTMLPLKFGDEAKIREIIRERMDRGLLHKHLMEESECKELNLSIVPYWIVAVSARTTYTAVDPYAEVGTVATTAALFGLMGGSFGGRNRGMGTGLLEGAMLGGFMGGGMGGSKRAYTLNENYQYPVVAMKALSAYQPKEYSFALSERTLFDASTFPKGIKILNGDIGEDAAIYEAKTYVSQLQAEKAHSQHHMIQNLNTQLDAAEPELLHVPVWFARFENKKGNIVLVIDGNSGNVINSIGLD
jgi:ribosomal protein S27E